MDFPMLFSSLNRHPRGFKDKTGRAPPDPGLCSVASVHGPEQVRGGVERTRNHNVEIEP